MYSLLDQLKQEQKIVNRKKCVSAILRTVTVLATSGGRRKNGEGFSPPPPPAFVSLVYNDNKRTEVNGKKQTQTNWKRKNKKTVNINSYLEIV